MKTTSPARRTPDPVPPVLQRRRLFSTRPFAPPGVQEGPAPQEAPAAAPGMPGMGYHFADIPVRGARSPLPPRAMPDPAGLAAPGPSCAPPQAARPNPTGLPDRLQAGIEALSGMALEAVRVHYQSAKPAQFQALAYTQGTEIYLGPGQEQHLAHEAWHVVQQKQGRVRPTLQLKGEQVNDDQGLEREAEVMGTKAVQMRHSEKSAFEFPIHLTSGHHPPLVGHAAVQCSFRGDPALAEPDVDDQCYVGPVAMKSKIDKAYKNWSQRYNKGALYTDEATGWTDQETIGRPEMPGAAQPLRPAAPIPPVRIPGASGFGQRHRASVGGGNPATHPGQPHHPAQSQASFPPTSRVTGAAPGEKVRLNFLSIQRNGPFVQRATGPSVNAGSARHDSPERSPSRSLATQRRQTAPAAVIQRLQWKDLPNAISVAGSMFDYDSSSGIYWKQGSTRGYENGNHFTLLEAKVPKYVGDVHYSYNLNAGDGHQSHAYTYYTVQGDAPNITVTRKSNTVKNPSYKLQYNDKLLLVNEGGISWDAVKNMTYQQYWTLQVGQLGFDQHVLNFVRALNFSGLRKKIETQSTASEPDVAAFLNYGPAGQSALGDLMKRTGNKAIKFDQSAWTRALEGLIEVTGPRVAKDEAWAKRQEAAMKAGASGKIW